MRRFTWRFLRQTWLGLALALALLWLTDLFPLGGLVEMVRVPLASIIVICAIGKALYDTLFFDHYWP